VPSISLKPQRDGSYAGYSSIVGATYAYQAVDDSEGTTHDSAATYFVLPRLIGSAGTVSFPFFRGWSGGRPTSITVNVVARRGGGAHPRIQIGFVRSTTFAFDATLFDAGAGFTLASPVFTIDPITGQAWDPEDLGATEVALRSEFGAIGSNDVTLVSVSPLVYREPHNHLDPGLPYDARIG
jgi:hypothetical protein